MPVVESAMPRTLRPEVIDCDYQLVSAAVQVRSEGEFEQWAQGPVTSLHLHVDFPNSPRGRAARRALEEAVNPLIFADEATGHATD